MKKREMVIVRERATSLIPERTFTVDFGKGKVTLFWNTDNTVYVEESEDSDIQRGSVLNVSKDGNGANCVAVFPGIAKPKDFDLPAGMLPVYQTHTTDDTPWEVSDTEVINKTDRGQLLKFQKNGGHFPQLPIVTAPGDYGLDYGFYAVDAVKRVWFAWGDYRGLSFLPVNLDNRHKEIDVKVLKKLGAIPEVPEWADDARKAGWTPPKKKKV